MEENSIQIPNFREAIRDLTLMDDVFMRTVMKDRRCAEYVLHIILEKSDLVLDGGYPEADMKNLWGRSLIMDFTGWDNDNTNYNIEVQKRPERASPDFTLYCYSMLASHTMKEGEKFESVKRKHVIVMIVDGDPLKLDLPVSHNSLHNDETGVKIDAGLAIIYVDATRYDEDTEVGRLMKDFHQKNAADMEKSPLQEAVHHYKETEKGINEMTETLERYFDQYVVPYVNMAKKQQALETVRRMIDLGDSDEDICKRANITTEEIVKIRKEMNK